MQRLAQLLAVRSGEGRLAGLVIGVMLLTSMGSALGGAGIDTLFYTRFGVQYLPYMFMILSVVTIATSLGVTALLGRLRRERLYVALPLAVAIFLLAARLLLTLDFRALYPVLWIGKEVANNLIGFMVWGAAGLVFDSRQARRLFPLFGAGRILGSVIGGLLTGWFVSLGGTENLVALWVGAMLLAFIFSRLLLRGRAHPAPRRGSRAGGQPGFFREIRKGYQYIRGSSLMRWISVAAVLFSILFFSIALPFSRAATLQFPQEAALAGFLGAFEGLSTAAAFLASLFLTNRLFARFGIMTVILAGPVTYLLGFGAMAVAPVFVIIVAFRFVQMLWLSGLADPAWQAMFNVVPAERRDQVRAFMGIPDQAGTLIAGLVLLIGQQTLNPRQLSLIGLLGAAVCTYVVWRSRRAYYTALVDALRLGRSQVFFNEEEPFGGFRRDSAATAALIAGTHHDDLVIRRVATEILGQVHVPDAAEVLVNALSDPDAVVRKNALKALASRAGPSWLPEIERMLRDPDAEVRIEAIACLLRLDLPIPDVRRILEPLLADPLPAVRIRA
ncbi:MAG: HEAT repeat domain-containing protein, partial [Bacteroidota bacterium]